MAGTLRCASRAQGGQGQLAEGNKGCDGCEGMGEGGQKGDWEGRAVGEVARAGGKEVAGMSRQGTDDDGHGSAGINKEGFVKDSNPA